MAEGEKQIKKLGGQLWQSTYMVSNWCNLTQGSVGCIHYSLTWWVDNLGVLGMGHT